MVKYFLILILSSLFIFGCEKKSNKSFIPVIIQGKQEFSLIVIDKMGEKEIYRDTKPIGFAFQSKSNTLLYGITEKNKNFIYRIDFDGKKEKIFETEKIITNFVGSFDGKRIALVSKNEIWVIENGKKNVISLPQSNLLSFPYSLSFSKEKIVFLFGKESPFKTNLWIINCKDYSLKQLTFDNNIFFNDNPLPLSWSPDENKILVLTDRGIMIVSLKNDIERHISFEEIELGLFRPIFSSNEEIIFVGKRKGDLIFNIYILELKTQKLKQITKDINVYGELSLSPNGKKIAFVVFDKNYGIWTINKDGTGLKKLTEGLDNSDYRYPIWLKDDRLVCLKIKTF